MGVHNEEINMKETKGQKKEGQENDGKEIC
jgi:hypothetical protein